MAVDFEPDSTVCVVDRRSDYAEVMTSDYRWLSRRVRGRSQSRRRCVRCVSVSLFSIVMITS